MSYKPHVEWLTKSASMYDSFEKGFTEHVRGGRLYELEAIKLLSDAYKVSINSEFIKRNGLIKYVLKNHISKITGDICVLDPYVLAFGKFNKNKINIAIVHHIDTSFFNKSLFSKFFYYQLKKNLKKMDKVIVVSKVWADFLKNIGVKNCEIVYNAFELNNYSFSDEQKQNFKIKHKLNTSKSIIYLGQLVDGKGIEEVLGVIDKEKYQLIVTSRKPIESRGIASYYFTDSEFRLFLSCCDLVLCMSTMTEGWNRIAHEALLVKTPVIGSGTGGMKELLLDSKQIMVTDIEKLPAAIQMSLENASFYENEGRKYVEQYDLDYFKSRWITIIEELLKDNV